MADLDLNIDICKEQEKHDELRVIKEFLVSGALPPDPKESKQVQNASQHLQLDAHGCLILKQKSTIVSKNQPARVVVPLSLQKMLLEVYHDCSLAGHGGLQKQLIRLVYSTTGIK